MELPATLMFDYPTIRALVAHLTAGLASDSGAPPAVGAVPEIMSIADKPAGAAAFTLQQVNKMVLDAGMPLGCTSLQCSSPEHKCKSKCSTAACLRHEQVQSGARHSTCQHTASWLQNHDGPARYNGIGRSI